MNEAVRAVKMFELYVRFAWPIHRLLVRNRIAKRCTSCAASEKMVPLSSDGVCTLCHQARLAGAPVATGEDAVATRELARILGESQGAGAGEYDALILFSGGKDSTYMIARLRSEFPGLRMLAYTIDNGFMSPIAQQNVQELLGKLDIDHVFVRPQHSFYEKLFRYCLTHLNAGGGYATLDFSDGEFMLDSARSMAAERAIPVILCGYSRYQVQNGLGFDAVESPRSLETSDRTETAGIKLTDMFGERDLARWWHGSRWPENKVARLVFPLYAWNLEEQQVKNQVAAWGLLTDKQYSPAATNHQLIPLVGVVDVHQRGYSSFESEFCRMIRDGKANRREWQMTFECLEHISRTGLFVKPMALSMLERLRLEPADVGIHFH